MSSSTAGSMTSRRILALTAGRTALTVLPLRSAATSTGTCSDDWPACSPSHHGDVACDQGYVRPYDLQQIGFIGFNNAGELLWAPAFSSKEPVPPTHVPFPRPQDRFQTSAISPCDEDPITACRPPH